MTTTDLSLEQRVAKIEGEILDLRGRSRILAWLHAELVFELQFIFERLLGSDPRPINPADQARINRLRTRAARLARIRNAKGQP